MVKASALHLVLVIILVVTVLLGSLIYLHGFYREQQQKIDRRNMLEQQIEEAITLSLSNDFPHTLADSLLPSPIGQQDSIRIGKYAWGLFDLVRLYSWRTTDTLKRSFLVGEQTADSTVLYIADEDRPLSVSGKTLIQGMAFLPKSGIRPAFVDGRYYEGIEEMVDGNIEESERTFPAYNKDRLQALSALPSALDAVHLPYLPNDAVVRQSFFTPMAPYGITGAYTLMQDSVCGHVLIMADSSVTVTAHTVWEDAILIAPHIRLADHFSGKGQFFAFDSLTVGQSVKLAYPSVLAVLTPDSLQARSKLVIGDNSSIAGLVLLHRAAVEEQKDMLECGKNIRIHGDIISFGLLKYSDRLTVEGSLYSYRLITQRPSSLYENYLIDLTLERNKLHPYYLRPSFWTSDKQKKQAVVKWLN